MSSAESRTGAPHQDVDAYPLEPSRAAIAQGEELLRLLSGAQPLAGAQAKPRWTSWVFAPGPQQQPIRIRISDAADPAVAIEADADGIIVRSYALGSSREDVDVLPHPRMRRLAVVLPAAQSSAARVSLNLPDRDAARSAEEFRDGATQEPVESKVGYAAGAPEATRTEAGSSTENYAGVVAKARFPSPGQVENAPLGQGQPPALQVRYYSRAKRFDDLARLGETIGLDDAAEPETLLSLIDAYANVARPDDVRRLITAAVIGPHHARYGVGVLVRLYSFEALLPRPVTGILRTAILAKFDTYDGTPERLLHLAHQAMRDDDWELVVRAREKSHQLSGQAPDQQARLDIQEAQLSFLAGDFSSQLRALNRAIMRNGLGPLSLIDAGRPVSADNLNGRDHKTIEGDLPQVSVIMTIYNRERILPHAARSILEQSYRELELVLVDDHSEDGSLRVAHEIAAQDPRVRVVELGTNSGTYVARNEGLRVCQGEFVTCQDSDDFAHPEKLETAIRHLLLHDAPLATTVKHVRCNDSEGFKSRVGYIRRDFSSLLFRRGPTLDRVGFFDCCRAGADAEFQLRMRRIAGENSIVDLPHLASVVDAGAHTLTSGGHFAMDDDQGVMSPQRNAYRRSFLKWHASTDNLRLDYPQDRRPFEIV